VVENHVNNPEIVIADTNPKQVVYIYGCKNSTVQVPARTRIGYAMLLPQLICRSWTAWPRQELHTRETPCQAIRHELGMSVYIPGAD